MRWKAYFFLQTIPRLNPRICKSSVALKLMPTRLILKKLDTFESDLIKLVKSVRYRNVSDGIQWWIKSDLKDIEGIHKIFVKADKSDNLYKTSPNKQTNVA